MNIEYSHSKETFLSERKMLHLKTGREFNSIDLLNEIFRPIILQPKTMTTDWLPLTM